MDEEGILLQRFGAETAVFLRPDWMVLGVANANAAEQMVSASLELISGNFARPAPAVASAG